VECRNGRLLVDAGWAGTLPQLQHALQRYGLTLPQIKYVMLTHHHPDHAGLTQEVKRAAGARLLIHERQIPFLRDLQTFYQRKGGYSPIVVARDDLVVGSHDSREKLRAIGVEGEIVETPGHSDDSVSLVLEDGAAFTGDLYLPNMVEEDKTEAVRSSWRKLLRLNVQTVYPGHAKPFPMKYIEQLL
jgi:glyoxylase-like metal-dependent hydrolase (beta-lactamase superfamily II)